MLQSILHVHIGLDICSFICHVETRASIHAYGSIKGITKFWYGVMNLVQMNILQAYAILQYLMIVVAVEIES